VTATVEFVGRKPLYEQTFTPSVGIFSISKKDFESLRSRYSFIAPDDYGKIQSYAWMNVRLTWRSFLRYSHLVSLQFSESLWGLTSGSLLSLTTALSNSSSSTDVILKATVTFDRYLSFVRWLRALTHLPLLCQAGCFHVREHGDDV
jgi:hypothetical protein